MLWADVEQKGCNEILETKLFKLATDKSKSDLHKDQKENIELE